MCFEDTINVFSKGDRKTIRQLFDLTCSSTEAELVAVDDVMVMVLWMQLILDQQGYAVERKVIYQDSQSVILLKTNEQRSAIPL